MTADSRSRSQRAGELLAWLALAAALCAVATPLLAALGYRLRWWSLRPSLQAMPWAAGLGLGAVVAGTLATALQWRGAAARPRWAAWVALAAGLAVAVPLGLTYSRAQSVPRIHDISTDTERPPAFVAVLPQREGARNPAAYDPAVAKQQKAGYPDIAPLTLPQTPAQAFELALQAVHAAGWTLVAAVPQEGRIEATDRTRLFGFIDDVVIRIEPQASGSRVDVRSLSRVGVSDLGTNAARVRGYLARLRGASGAG